MPCKRYDTSVVQEQTALTTALSKLLTKLQEPHSAVALSAALQQQRTLI